MSARLILKLKDSKSLNDVLMDDESSKIITVRTVEHYFDFWKLPAIARHNHTIQHSTKHLQCTLEKNNTKLASQLNSTTNNNGNEKKTDDINNNTQPLITKTHQIHHLSECMSVCLCVSVWVLLWICCCRCVRCTSKFVFLFLATFTIADNLLRRIFSLKKLLCDRSSGFKSAIHIN